MSGRVVEAHVEAGLHAAVDPDELEAVVDFALRREGCRDAALSITLLGDAGIAELHRAHLGHEGPTDVISFPLPGPGASLVGDVYIGAEQARRQAAEWGEAARVELLRLAVHGTLHVLGYDHPEEAREESAMYARQEEILAAYLATAGAR